MTDRTHTATLQRVQEGAAAIVAQSITRAREGGSEQRESIGTEAKPVTGTAEP
jgi:hypothetical protein